DVRALDVGKAVLLRQLSGADKQIERRAQLSAGHSCPTLREQRAELELARLRRMGDSLERVERVVVMLTFDCGLGAHDRGLDLRVLVPGLASLEVRRVDAEPLCDPAQGLRSRTSLAALDLTHVLLGETVACELGLGQARGDAQLSQSGTKSRRRALRRRKVCEGAA